MDTNKKTILNKNNINKIYIKIVIIRDIIIIAKKIIANIVIITNVIVQKKANINIILIINKLTIIYINTIVKKSKY